MVRGVTAVILLSAMLASAQPLTIPAGTPVRIRTTNTLTTKRLHSGDRFSASLDEPILVGGQQVARRGAPVTGQVINANRGGRIRGKAHLELQLLKLTLANGRTVAINTNEVGRQARSTKKRDAGKILGSTGTGAAIGALAGGGVGAGIGATIGAAAGTGLVLGTRGAPAVIPAESRLTFRLGTPITVER